jgi:hypothetical protein
MLVTESRRRSNPRVLYGILAQSALEQLGERPAAEDIRRAYLQNVVRLLEMYRFETLRRTTPRAVLDRSQVSSNSLRREREENELVANALESAHQRVYPDLTRDELVLHLKGLFSQLYREELHNLTREEMRKARSFLESFAAALRM